MGENKVQIVIEARDAFSRIFNAAVEAFNELVRVGDRVSNRLSNDFKTLNLGTALDIEKEKVKLTSDFGQIEKAGVTSAQEIKREQQALKGQLSEVDKELKGNVGSVLSLKGAAGALSGALATVGIGALAKDAINAALQLQKMETAFRSVAGVNAGRELAFVREEANRLGLDLGSAAGEYGKLAAAAKGTALEGEETRRVFTAVSEAATALGLSGEETSGALNALQQMISKGKVSAEELRQQLGERLPGAFQLAAKAMGVSTAELDKMMEQGQLTADDLLPKLAAALHDTYGVAALEASEKGQAAINRFNNELLLTKAAVGESLMPALTDILKGMKPISEGLMWLLNGFASLGPLLGMIIDKMSALARAPLDGFDATKKRMEEIENNFYAIVGDIQRRYNGHVESSKKTDKEQTDEQERNAERRAEAAKKSAISQAKSAETYAKAIGDTDKELTAVYEKAYQDRVAKVEAFYDEQIKTAGNNKALLQDIEIAKFNDLNRLAEQHKADDVLKELDKQSAVLATARKGGEDRIALIELQIAQRIRSEADGAAEILGIRRKQADDEYKLAEARFNKVAEVYDADSEQYVKAQEAKLQAATNLTQAENDLAREAAEARREVLEKSSLDYELELKKRLDWLRDSERDGLITHQQAVRDKLEAERDYLARIAELRGRELANELPDTVEYKRALAEKYQADREYYEAKKALDDQINAEILGRYQREAAEAEATSKKEQTSFHSFAEWFYAQWDGITNRVVSLGPKVAAAFGVSVKQTALDTVDGLRVKLEEVAAAVRKADEASRDWFQFGRMLGDHAEKAEQLTYRYYSQRLAVAELTEQLKAMGLATSWQVERANGLIRQMDLLDEADLAGVRSEVDRLTESLKEAQEQAEDTVDSLRDELDEMLGNRTAIEERDYQAKKDDLMAKLADAQAAGNLAIVQEYNEALRLLEEIHQRKLANIKAEAEAARKAREESASGSASLGTIPGFAGGGRFPGPDSPVDNLIVAVRSGEWGIRNEAVKFWESNVGRGFMAGINDPLSAAGRQIWERLKARASGWKDYLYIPTPRVSFATGGSFADAASLQGGRGASGGHTFNFYNTGPVDKKFVRREVIPELERHERLKK